MAVPGAANISDLGGILTKSKAPEVPAETTSKLGSGIGWCLVHCVAELIPWHFEGKKKEKHENYAKFGNRIIKNSKLNKEKGQCDQN